MRRFFRRALISLLVLAAVFYAGGGWYFSNLINERALDGPSMRAGHPGDYDLHVVSLTGDRVELSAPSDAVPQALMSNGVWGLRWPGGYARVGDRVVIGDAADGTLRVERKDFELMSGSLPTPGQPAALDVRAYPSQLETPLDIQNVSVPGPLGNYPAWFVPGDRSAWAIVVHGNSMTRLDGMRAVPIFNDAGFPVLVPTIRNDPGAPADPSGRLQYGVTEWKDLEAAVRFALDRGATDVILDGYSMGGGIIMAFMQNSALANKVTAIVLDAPMLDFGQTVDDNASRETLPVVGLPLPMSLTSVAKQMAAWRFGVDWHALDYLGVNPGVPTLIFHGTRDLTVPISTSEEFSQHYPDEATLVRCPDAGHIACWNLDPQAYEDRVGAFLKANARVESAPLSCPPGSLLGGAQLDGVTRSPTPDAAIARQNPGDGKLVRLQRRANRSRQADAEYLLVRGGVPIRLYSLDHSAVGWSVDSISFCGDIGGSG